MKAVDLGRLFILAAIWGASFLFFRVAAPVLGALVTVDLRALIGGLDRYFPDAGFRHDLGARYCWTSALRR